MHVGRSKFIVKHPASKIRFLYPRCAFPLALCLALFCLFSQSFPAQAGGIVHLYGWTGYVDPKALEDFTKETGIKVSYDGYQSEETAGTLLKAGRSGYDVVIVSGRLLQREIAEGLYLKLDQTRLPNSQGVWPQIRVQLSVLDPGNQYAVNYLWATIGLAYNMEKVKELVGDADLLDSWGLVFRPEVVKKFSGCGVKLPDSAEDLFAIALWLLRQEPASAKPADIRRAADVLNGIRRSVQSYDRDIADALVNGDVCLAVADSGETFQARDRAREAEAEVEIDYSLPREGAPLLVDNLAILKDAEHVAEAYALIDYLLRPAIAARNTNFTHRANSIPASLPSIDKAIATNPAIYPPAPLMERLFVPAFKDSGVQKYLAKEWAQIKSGK